MILLDYKSGKPLHEQIRSGIKELIMRGSLKQDEQLPSVREMSVNLTVNPNTVLRAYKDLEAEGFIYSVKGRGSFVSGLSHFDKSRTQKLYSDLDKTVRELFFNGESKEKIMDMINTIHLERSNGYD